MTQSKKPHLCVDSLRKSKLQRALSLIVRTTSVVPIFLVYILPIYRKYTINTGIVSYMKLYC